MGTIANAKVTHYYNCYNGDFIGCLLYIYLPSLLLLCHKNKHINQKNKNLSPVPMFNLLQKISYLCHYGNYPKKVFRFIEELIE